MAELQITELKRIYWTNLSLLNITPARFKGTYQVELNR